MPSGMPKWVVPKKKECPVCGIIFYDYDRTKYCSVECADVVYRRDGKARTKEFKKRHPDYYKKGGKHYKSHKKGGTEMTLGELVKEQEEGQKKKKSFLEGWYHPNVKPEEPKKTIQKKLPTIDENICKELEKPEWIKVFVFNKNEVVIKTADCWNYRLLIKKVIHTPTSTKLFVVEVKNEVEFEQQSISFRNEFFCDDFNFLCDMIREQLEHKYKAGIEVDLKTLFKSTLPE
jgi:hypothetical protein